MDFKTLYSYCEEQMTKADESGDFRPITVYEIKKYLIENTEWLGGVNFYPVSCEVNDPYGHFECHGENESRWDDPDSWVVVISYNQDERILNYCKKRFVWLKELMHIFDPDDTCAVTKKHFFDLMSEIETRPLDKSEAFETENSAKWLALLLFVPKSFRDRAKSEIESGKVSKYEIALKYRIPESVVSSLISEYYINAYEKFLK